jgi:hypothetical protein
MKGLSIDEPNFTLKRNILPYRYIILILLGAASGALALEMSAQSFYLWPARLFLNSGPLPVLTALALLFIPFLVGAAILVFKFQGYRSFIEGFTFSLAYCLPLKYWDIWISMKHPGDPFTGSTIQHVLIFLLVAIILSGNYYLLIKWQNRLKRKCGT